MVTGSLAKELDALVQSAAPEGRRIGQIIDADPDRVDIMADFGLSSALNTLGCPTWMRPVPFTQLDGRSITHLSVVQRCILYEALGYVDPNLLFAAPGPSMSAFVVNCIGNDEQKHWFFRRFAAKLTWSFFALTEPATGSDAGRISTTATRAADGYRLNGQKYLIGNGAIASIGIVFARTAPGPLGIDAFLIEPRDLAGLEAHPLPATGCRGANLAHLIFNNVLLPHHALLGAHLKPTERRVSSAAATFDALRPCVAAIAVGIARAVLDRAESAGMLTRSADRDALTQARLTLDALRDALRQVCASFDAGHRQSRSAGHLKAVATNCAEAIIADVIARSEPSALVAHPWLAKAWRDIKAFEYTEGTTHIHLLNTATLFREGG
jgi:alkylation response protein AidB-like acyl-CoA dehydrogenase